uniref:uncharacterized protein LOC120335559 isoform X2 n=1 Tax=Styela clava TaxID=7725 RepID=UPI0019392B3D|nr:uncharacterized protein LOC120335559 isoform X2 [Styela clava]
MTNFTIYCCLCFMALAVITELATSCHNDYHQKQRSTNPDGTKKKREIAGNTSLTVQDFFPVCLETELTEDESYSGKSFVGAINFVIFHSSWYESVNNTICEGGNDTVECWMTNLATFIDGNSPAFRAAQDCVIDYYEVYYGVSLNITEYPSGTPYNESDSCADVDVNEFETEFISDLNITALEYEDLTATDIDDLLQFIQYDMICPDCTCDDLDNNDEYFETLDFEDGTSCGDCWSSRFATGIRHDSILQKPASKLAAKKLGLKPSNICPPKDIDFSSENIVTNILGINVTCGIQNTTISLESCGLADLGYVVAQEIFINDPTKDTDPEIVPPECFPKLKNRNGKNDKIAVFTFPKHECWAHEDYNETHVTYTYAIRNMEAEDLYSVSIIDRHVELDINISCSHPNGIISLPFPVETLTRTASFQLSEHSQPVQVKMEAYKDSHFHIPYSAENATVEIPDNIWIRFSHDGDDSIFIEVFDCWITPTANIGDEYAYFVVYGGCPEKENNGTGTRDAALQLRTCVNTTASFGFASFKWSGLNPDIYTDDNSLHLHCEIILHRWDNLPCYNKSCSPPPTSRKRRREVERSAVDLQMGPIISTLNNCPNNECNCTQRCFGCDDYGNSNCGCLNNYFLMDDGRTCALLDDSWSHERAHG